MDHTYENRKDTDNVADSFQKLYSELPLPIDINSSSHVSEDINSRIKTSQSNKNSHNNSESEPGIIGFLKSYLPTSDHKEIKDELKKTFPLHKQRGGKIKTPQSKRKGKYLTAHERRKLGLNRLPKSGGLKVTLVYSDAKVPREICDCKRILLGYVNVIKMAGGVCESP